MAEEEFQESDIIFHDRDSSYNMEPDQDDIDFHKHKRKKKLIKVVSIRRKNNAASSPVINIPSAAENHVHVSRDNKQLLDYNIGYDHEDEEEMVPPHIITGRRVAISDCAGKGLTLKGRGLCELRDSILRTTGFLEA